MARAWLEERGLAFVESNFRTRYGEIDLVMRDGPVTVLVEIKTRRNRRFGAPEEAISDRKLARLQAAAEIYLSRHPAVGDIRLDVLVIEHQGGAWSVRHLPGIS